LLEVGFPERVHASTRLSPGVWAAIARAAWLLDRCECGEPVSVACQRAARLAVRLGDLAYAHGSVVAVGHGWFNLFVGRELRRRQAGSTAGAARVLGERDVLPLTDGVNGPHACPTLARTRRRALERTTSLYSVSMADEEGSDRTRMIQWDDPRPA